MSPIQAGTKLLGVVSGIDREWYRVAVPAHPDLVVRMEKGMAAGDHHVGDKVSAYLYRDRQGRWMATEQTPSILLDELGLATVRQQLTQGLSVDAGWPMLFTLPERELPDDRELWPLPDEKVYVQLTTAVGGGMLATLPDEELIGSVASTADNSLHNQIMEARVVQLIGPHTFLLIDGDDRGLLQAYMHETERDGFVRIGEKFRVRIAYVREDGKLNVSMLPRKEDARVVDAEQILVLMKQNNGRLPFTDKSSPQEIRQSFAMSKAAFKRALGKLMKDELVEQDAHEIRLMVKQHD